MKSHSATRIAASLFLLLISMQTYAAQWYHVEVVVFEQLNTVTDEQWPLMTDSDIKISLTPDMASPIIQPASNNRMNNIAASLSRSSQYRVHYHRSWQQPIQTKGRAKAVQISSDDGLIEGYIRLDKATYLHATVELWLKENTSTANSWSDTSPTGIDVNAPRNPHMEQSRRIRSKERYFFDHPKMGVLLEITPVTTPVGVQASIEPLETYSLPNEATPTENE